MKPLIWLTILWLMLCLPPGVPAQNNSGNAIKPIAQDFIANGTVLELTVPKEYEGVSLYAVWDPKENYAKAINARAGTHSYEMRNLPEWKGRIEALGVTAPNITGRIKTPTLPDELDIFFEPEVFAPTSVNFQVEHTFLTYPMVEWLFLLMIVPTLWLFVRRKKRLGTAVGIAFLLCLTLMEVRALYDDVIVVSNTEHYLRDLDGVFPLAGAKTFGDKAAELIGRSSWGTGQVDGVFRSYVRYRLAEQVYVPDGSDEQPAFRVTRNPQEGVPIFNHGNFYLMKTPRK